MPLPVNIEHLLSKYRIESNRIEFKKGWNPDDVLRSVCAFANDFDNIGGGYIVIGVEEEKGVAVRPVLGIQENQIDVIQRELLDDLKFLKPDYKPKTSVEEVDGKLLLVVWVPSGANRPYTLPESVTSSKKRTTKHYIRYGSSTIAAEGADLAELIDLSRRVPFDDRGNAEIQLSDISNVMLADYLNKTGSRLAQQIGNAPLQQILEQMNLMTGPAELRYVRNVAAMMFSEHPERFFPYTQVEVVIFPRGRIEAPENHITPPFFCGPVPKVIAEVLSFLKTSVIKEHIRKVSHDEHAVRFFNYPLAAVEEGVVNAMYHRDYSQHEPVEITVEPHQISILSYSGPDRSISDKVLAQAEVISTRRYRNRRLGDFLRDLDLTEGRATGIPTIQKTLAQNGSPRASIETDKHRSFFKLVIPCHPGALNDLAELCKVEAGDTRDFLLNNLRQYMGENWNASYMDALQRTILALSEPRTARELQEFAKVSSSMTFRRNLLSPLLESGLLEYTHPHAPRCASQKYKLNPRAEALRLMLQNA